MKNEIILFEGQNVKLEVNMKDETVWLSLDQMSNLFGRDKSVISRHIKSVLTEELEYENSVIANFATTAKERDTSVVAKFATTAKDGKVYQVEYYNLDVIISVGYRVKSKNGILFRKWANKVLKDYLIKGYAANELRLEYLEKTVKLLDIANRMEENTSGKDVKEVLKVIGNYSKALDLLDDYDHKTIKKVKGIRSEEKITYEEAIGVIKTLKFNEKSDLFALERNKGLKSVIDNIYLTFDGKDVYESIEEKAANFLYMIIKNQFS